ncbi:PASTA domain-containing protein [Plantactinospora sp. GCM10030261]|uniref:Stk1 family PASTA domain-containing Ser/Thr kinase n=1 Tax=Plantactinospora sp. GCM10030261 TaxID=3273420 RepID=UPI0036110B22
MPDQGERPRSGGEGDETRPIPPEGEPGAAPQPDATQAMPPSDGTRPMASDATRPMPPSDATRPMPPDATRRHPATGPDDRTTAGTPPVWSGRAGVPPPSAGRVREPAPPDWEDVREPSRPWWMPILLGILALILFGGIAIGLWLIARSTGEGGGTPTPPATTAPTTASAEPTSAAPTSAATTAAPAIAVPPIVGLPQDAARTVLDQLGLAYRLEFRESDRPPGVVLATDPEAGAQVPEGTVITLVISQAPTTPSATEVSPPVTGTPSPTG